VQWFYDNTVSSARINYLEDIQAHEIALDEPEKQFIIQTLSTKSMQNVSQLALTARNLQRSARFSESTQQVRRNTS